jgi:hypothetical protein
MSRQFELAGFSDSDGKMGRPVPDGLIIVPQKIWLKDNCIRWKMGKPRARVVSRSMLNQFVRLSDADSVLRFAREWGVLALSDNLFSGSDPGGQSYLPGRQWLKEGVELLSAWHYYSRRAQALLHVASDLKRGKLGDMSDWGEFAAFIPGEKAQKTRVMRYVKELDRHNFGLGFTLANGDGTHEDRLEVARGVIASEIGGWMRCWKKDKTEAVSDFALRWMSDQQRWDLQIDYHGLLFPAIALQLALVLAEAASLYNCSGCGIPYIRPRERKRPKSGWANYCDQCSEDGVAQRRAAESYREKRSEAVRLHSGGTSISEIAEQLKTEPARVRGWVEKSGDDAEKKTRK